ncbi:MAG: polysaccharide deacetylase family protein [Candidatus Omnitrophota bacterium]|nr:MAG: polysaccharide deacetylase family protein [Candidatus Omnitrophota bacterium]
MKLKKALLGAGLIILVSFVAFYLYLKPKYVVPILMYHHIDGRSKTSLVSVSPQNFRRQMRFLSERNYNVISLDKFVQDKLNGQEFPRNTVVITFDDGYGDNFTFAYPVLKEYNLPATIFVITDFIDKEGYLTSRQIKEMLSSGPITIGSHTLSEAFLPAKNTEELEREIGLSKKLLESKTGGRVDFLCYPFGHFTPQAQEIVKRYNYLAACTTNRGKENTYLNDDLFALKRIKIKDSANPIVLYVKLSGYYNSFRRVRKPY